MSGIDKVEDLRLASSEYHRTSDWYFLDNCYEHANNQLTIYIGKYTKSLKIEIL